MFLMKSAEARERWMFSRRENCWRIPPADSTVEAWEYCTPSEENSVIGGLSYLQLGRKENIHKALQRIPMEHKPSGKQNGSRVETDVKPT